MLTPVKRKREPRGSGVAHPDSPNKKILQIAQPNADVICPDGKQRCPARE